MTWEAWFEAKVSTCADVAFAEYVRDLYTTLYVYCRRGDLIVAAECPPGMELAFLERVPAHLTRDQMRAWIHTRARRVPCLPEDGDPICLVGGGKAEEG